MHDPYDREQYRADVEAHLSRREPDDLDVPGGEPGDLDGEDGMSDDEVRESLPEDERGQP